MELATDIMAIWREDFEQKLKKVGYVNAHLEKNNIGNYLDFEVGSMFRGFLMAKRNMPVVELPKPEMCFTSSARSHKSFAYVHLDPLISSLESAGIQFTIKGE